MAKQKRYQLENYFNAFAEDVKGNFGFTDTNPETKLINEPHDITYGTSWMVERGVQYDANNNRALVVDAARKEVLEIDLTTGEKTGLSDSNNASEVTLVAPEDMALGENDDGNHHTCETTVA